MVIRLFDLHEIVTFSHAGSIWKFLESQFNARCLPSGATHPLLVKLLPPDTWVVTVPVGETTLTVAKTVLNYCDAGGDAGVKAPPGKDVPIAVKVRLFALLPHQS